MLSKGGLTHQQLVNVQSDFRKLGAAAWLALKRETSFVSHIHRKWSSPRVSDLFMQAVFPYAKPGDLRKAMQGARIRTSAVLIFAVISLSLFRL
ncbi:hypothetical protein BASA81_011239 [Batrachochytrium salamandrivorans]|nr:hypothetical protein BASA81_011239 [Batrachochytrium salamandrivorans]